jgi:Flp pilus assembly pilin Flp
MQMLRRFLADESAATAIEYGLIAAGISLAIISVVNGPRHQPQDQVHLDQHLAEIGTKLRKPLSPCGLRRGSLSPASLG